jgi:hypothetical protein
MGSQIATNIINMFIALGTFAAVGVALYATWRNGKQARDDWSHSQQIAKDNWDHSQQQAIEVRKLQTRPIMAPDHEISHYSVITFDPRTGKANKSLYTSEHRINWSWPDSIRIDLRNMGNGPALNVQCILYGAENITQSQFVSWDNMPVEAKSPIAVALKHPTSDILLFQDDRVNGKHVLYDNSLDTPSNPWLSRIARLAVTYHDLFGTKYVSIFHYTIDHQWIHVVTEEITGNPARDLKELNMQKKQEGPKYSAPPIPTSN